MKCNVLMAKKSVHVWQFQLSKYCTKPSIWHQKNSLIQNVDNLNKRIIKGSMVVHFFTCSLQKKRKRKKERNIFIIAYLKCTCSQGFLQENVKLWGKLGSQSKVLIGHINLHSVYNYTIMGFSASCNSTIRHCHFTVKYQSVSLSNSARSNYPQKTSKYWYQTNW